jgi:hypothetical protein
MEREDERFCRVVRIGRTVCLSMTTLERPTMSMNRTWPISNSECVGDFAEMFTGWFRSCNLADEPISYSQKKSTVRKTMKKVPRGAPSV